MKKIALVLALALAWSTTAGAIEIAISTQAGWWGQAAADRETQLIVDSVKGATVLLFDSTHQADLAAWVREHTYDGAPDVLILCGKFPISIYPANNAKTEGSFAELFLDAGNCIINTGDWIFYVPSSGTNNGANGLVNMMDNTGVTVAGENDTAVTVSGDGQKYTPSLQNLATDRPFHLDTLRGDWYPELILAQNAAGTRADPVIVKNRATGARVGIFYQTNSQDNDPRGKVISEWINNWYLPMAANGGQALGPAPASKATDVPFDTGLSWKPSQLGATYDVYLGQTLADVNAASPTDAKGVLVGQGQAAASFQPALEYGKTYYWRVDEINPTPDKTLFKGEVWSFTTELYAYSVKPTAATASSFQPDMGPEKTIDGSGLTGSLHGVVETTMWLSTGVGPNWIQYEFDQAYGLHEMVVWNSNQGIESLLGFGAKTVTVETSLDGAMWTPVANVPEFARAPGAVDYAANTTVLLDTQAKFVKLTITANWGGMIPTTGLSEVQFNYAPLAARSPVPADKSRDVAVDAKLDWRPGRTATSHQVFLGTDGTAVTNGTVAPTTLTGHGFNPDLILNTSYYWKVDEVGTATYPGSVWGFTTQQYLPIDDFESYLDLKDEEVFSVWQDGAANQSGSVVGLFPDPINGTYCEMTIIHGGVQSMPFEYNNVKAPFYSETTRTFETPQDWTVKGANVLDLWFRGCPQAFVETAAGVTMSGGGADISGATNDFRYACKQLTGDGSITLRVDSVQPAAAWSKSGVMIRAGLDPLDMYVDLISAGAQNLLEFMYRPTTGVAATTAFNTGVGAGISTYPLPLWLRLTRAGDVFTAETSTDGTTWTKVSPATDATKISTQTLAMPATVYLGFVVDGGWGSTINRTLAVADFSQISTTGNVSAGPWQVVTVGTATSQPFNGPAPMYLRVEDQNGNKATVAYPDPAAANIQPWTEWKVAFSDLAGVNLAAVKKLTIGVGDGKTPSAGKLYFDDIRFGRVLTAVDPGPANLVALWDLDGDAKDSSGKGNDGTTTGAVQWLPGHTGQALKLLGNGTWVDCGTGPSLNVTDAVTVTAWVKLAAINGDRKVAGNNDAVGGGYKMGVYSTNKVEIEVRNAANKTDSNRSATGGTALEAGAWYHLAGVYSAQGGYFRTYVNGTLDREKFTTFVLAPSTLSFKIGREPSGTGTYWWLGLLDDVRVYNKALSSEEIAWLANQ